MIEAKLIEQSFTDAGGLSRRSRIVYDLTQKGINKFSAMTPKEKKVYNGYSKNIAHHHQP
jgi:hypothetical protein